MDTFPITKIDQKNEFTIEPFSTAEHYPAPASIALNLGALAMKFAHVERSPRYDETRRENDVEHSYMLALVANELAALLYPNLEAGKVTQFAIVHDLPETVTGDVKTFQFTNEQMAAKHAVEQNAMDGLIQTLPSYTAELLTAYEQQEVPEARFVKAVDKLLPVIVDILGAGKKVMNEDYGVTTSDELQASHNKLHSRIANSFEEFPPLVNAHNLLCKLFQIEFETTTR